MKISPILFLATGCALSSAYAQTVPFSYSFIQVGVSQDTFKQGRQELSGSSFGLSGSAAVSDSAFFYAGISQGTIGGLDLRSWSIGLGARSPVSDKTDLVAVVSYGRNEQQYWSGWAWQTGVAGDIGLRHAVSSVFELNGGVGISVFGNERIRTTTATLGLRYRLSDNLSLGLGAYRGSNFAGNGSGYGASLRSEFR